MSDLIPTVNGVDPITSPMLTRAATDPAFNADKFCRRRGVPPRARSQPGAARSSTTPWRWRRPKCARGHTRRQKRPPARHATPPSTACCKPSCRPRLATASTSASDQRRPVNPDGNVSPLHCQPRRSRRDHQSGRPGRHRRGRGRTHPDDRHPWATGSTTTYLKRYLLGRVFSLVLTDVQDDDGEASRQRVATPPSRPPVREAEPRQTVGAWLDALALELAACEGAEEVDAVLARSDVQAAQDRLQNGARDRLDGMLQTAIARTAEAETSAHQRRPLRQSRGRSLPRTPCLRDAPPRTATREPPESVPAWLRLPGEPGHVELVRWAMAPRGGSREMVCETNQTHRRAHRKERSNAVSPLISAASSCRCWRERSTCLAAGLADGGLTFSEAMAGTDEPRLPPGRKDTLPEPLLDELQDWIATTLVNDAALAEEAQDLVQSLPREPSRDVMRQRIRDFLDDG